MDRGGIRIVARRLKGHMRVWVLYVLSLCVVDAVELIDQESILYLEKLLEATELVQKGVSQNIANQHTSGYRRVQMNSGFRNQLKDMLEAGDLEAIKAFELKLEAGAEGVDFEKELRIGKENELENIMFNKAIANEFETLMTGINAME